MSALLDVIDRLVTAVLDRRGFYGVYEYRIVTYEASYLTLQATAKITGVPDALRIEPWHGLPGIGVTPNGGQLVLVQFINGSLARPFVMAWAPKSNPGHRAISLGIDADHDIALGMHSACRVQVGTGNPPKVSRVGDTAACGTLVVTGPGVALTYTPPGGAPLPPSTTVVLSAVIDSGSDYLRSK